MKSKNILLVFLCIAVLAIAVGFLGGRVSAPQEREVTENATSEILETTVESSDEPLQQEEPLSQDVVVGEVPTQTTDVEIVDVASHMTEAQRNMLKSFGLNPDEITITPGMIACAEAKVGATRIEEIINGSTPSFLEGASLIACYGQ